MPVVSVGDTFVETGVNVLLENHVPTGPNAAAGWVVAVGTCEIDVDATNDRIFDNNFGSGNRYRCTSDLGSDQMDVSIDITNVTVGTGFAGPMGRMPNSSAVGAEFQYDFGAGQWVLTDGTASATPVTEAWPGGTVTLTLKIRTGMMEGWAGGVKKISLASNLLAGNTRAGVLLGNFGGTATANTGDNFLATGIEAGAFHAHSKLIAPGPFIAPGGLQALKMARVLDWTAAAATADQSVVSSADFAGQVSTVFARDLSSATPVAHVGVGATTDLTRTTAALALANAGTFTTSTLTHALSDATVADAGIVANPLSGPGLPTVALASTGTFVTAPSSHNLAGTPLANVGSFATTVSALAPSITPLANLGTFTTVLLAHTIADATLANVGLFARAAIGVADAILLEDGSVLLLESGSKLLLERESTDVSLVSLAQIGAYASGLLTRTTAATSLASVAGFTTAIFTRSLTGLSVADVGSFATSLLTRTTAGISLANFGTFATPTSTHAISSTSIAPVGFVVTTDTSGVATFISIASFAAHAVGASTHDVSGTPLASLGTTASSVFSLSSNLTPLAHVGTSVTSPITHTIADVTAAQVGLIALGVIAPAAGVSVDASAPFGAHAVAVLSRTSALVSTADVAGNVSTALVVTIPGIAVLASGAVVATTLVSVSQPAVSQAHVAFFAVMRPGFIEIVFVARTYVLDGRGNYVLDNRRTYRSS